LDYRALAAGAQAVPSEPTAKRFGSGVLQGLLVLAILGVAGFGAWYALGQTGAGPPQSPPGGGAEQPLDLPPAGVIWFGESFDADTFEIHGRTSTVAADETFRMVAHLEEAVAGDELVMRVSWNGSAVANQAASEESESGDIWGWTLGPLFQAGSWRYELTDIGGNVLAAGTIEVTE
jgi:hypothetical protein